METAGATFAGRGKARLRVLIVLIVVLAMAAAGLSRHVFAGSDDDRKVTLAEPNVTPFDQADKRITLPLPTEAQSAWKMAAPVDPKEILMSRFAEANRDIAASSSLLAPARPQESVQSKDYPNAPPSSPHVVVGETPAKLKSQVIKFNAAAPLPVKDLPRQQDFLEPPPTERLLQQPIEPVRHEPRIEMQPEFVPPLPIPDERAPEKTPEVVPAIVQAPMPPKVDKAVVPAPAIIETLVPLKVDKAVVPVPAIVEAPTQSKMDKEVIPVSAQGCPTCGRRGGLPPDDLLSTGRCATCGGGDCVPGRKPCYPCESNTILGGFFCDLYQCICCPDPCYEPKWIPQADAAFFVDGARPQSQMRVGWDSAHNMILPDRSEYFWARADGSGKGPKAVAPFFGEQRLAYNDLNVYMETALGGFSTFVEMPYRSLDPTLAPHASGFSDMNVGTKSLLFDCELLQITFQFRTFIPIGNSLKGLGTGHTSLEPSLLFALKLTQDTYLQGQFSEWIPLGGDPNYAGSILHTHNSLNHVLYRILPDVPIIGTFEVNTWSFQHGAYTDPDLGPFQKSSGETYASLGPGLRLVICDRVDFGVGTAFAVTERHFAATVVRTVFRVRF
jgi:hypothetical protein